MKVRIIKTNSIVDLGEGGQTMSWREDGDGQSPNYQAVLNSDGTASLTGIGLVASRFFSDFRFTRDNHWVNTADEMWINDDYIRDRMIGKLNRISPDGKLPEYVKFREHQPGQG